MSKSKERAGTPRLFIPKAHTPSLKEVGTASWGILALFNLAVMVFSMPRVRPRSLYWMTVILFVLAFPNIRHLVDGNFEGVMILGLVLAVYGYQRDKPWALAVGILFASAKPQTTMLALIVLGLFILQAKPPRFWLRTLGVALIIVVPTMLWRGQEWLNIMFNVTSAHLQQGSIMDISLLSTLRRTELFAPAIQWLLWGSVLAITGLITWFSQRTFTREKAGYLVAASLLIAPYAGSTLTLLAVGGIPLFLKRRWLGSALLAFSYGQYFLNQPSGYTVFAYYSTIYLILMWLALMWHVWQIEITTRKASALVTAVQSTD